MVESSSMEPMPSAEGTSRDQECELHKFELNFQPRHFWRPLSCVQAIRWSEENLLAVAINDGICIVSPDCSEDLRGMINLGSAAGSGLIGSLTPAGSEHHLNFRVKGISTEFCRPPPTTRDLSWSPLGVSWVGGCVLAICTRANQVRKPKYVIILVLGFDSKGGLLL
jgi:hypothetical protein